jgi:predicted ester cyclase
MEKSLMNSKHFLGSLLTLSLVFSAALAGGPKPGSADYNEQVAKRYVAAYNDRDLDAIRTLFAEQVVVNDEEMNADAFMDIVRQFIGWFPDIVLEPTHVQANDTHVTLRMEFSGTGSGTLNDHDIDGKQVHGTETALFEIVEGKVTGIWYEWDELSFWVQLGVLERP